MGQAAPIIITVVAVVATIYAGPMVGAAILESMGTTAAAIGVSEAVVGAAAISGATGAVNAAVQGKNVEGILEAGAIGAASGAAGAAVGGAVAEGVTGATGGPVAVASDLGPTMGANAPGAISGGAAGGGTSAFTRAQLSGSNLDQSLKQGEIGTATGAITSAIGQGVQAGGGSPEDIKLASSLSGPFVAQNVSNLFSPTQSSSTYGGGSTSSQPPTSTVTTTGQPGSSPGSSALGQALRVGDPGAPIESPGGGEKSSAPVWNIASLRTKDETGG
jgi:hypothetical protein